MHLHSMLMTVASVPVTLFALSSPSSALVQDAPAEGFDAVGDPYPGGGLTATLANGDVLTFDGVVVSRFDEDGNHVEDLATLPGFVFGSFLIASPDESFAILGESSAHNVYRIDLGLGGESVLTNLVFNYDGVFETATSLVVSAATCGFGCGNELYRVDTTSGATTLIATVGGASGPVAVEADGDVVYGRVSDTFSLGDYKVLRFAAADLTGAPVASEADAVVVGDGFDGSTDLAIDPIDGAIYLAENDFVSGLNRIRHVRGDAAVSTTVLDGQTGRTIGNLEFAAGDGTARFRAYQPLAGGALRYNSTDFVSAFERGRVVPERPTLGLSGPGTSGAGDVTATVSSGTPNGFAVLAYGPTALFDRNESPLFLSALEAPLFVGLDLATVQLDLNLIALDASGTGQLAFPHDGSLLGLVTGQAVVFDDLGAVVQLSRDASL